MRKTNRPVYRIHDNSRIRRTGRQFHKPTPKLDEKIAEMAAERARESHRRAFGDRELPGSMLPSTQEAQLKAANPVKIGPNVPEWAVPYVKRTPV